MENFKPQKMVGWFDVGQLAGTGINALLSSVFGSFADKRETIASISKKEVYDYSDKGDLWLDYIADLGDGFDSTYTMAHLLAQKEIQVKAGENQVTLPRANVLVLGGDEVYPVANREMYQNRFVGPYEAALPEDKKDEGVHMFALPGNHDWYDGLMSFMKLFCQQRTIGNWKTKQNRSYFAIRLTGNTWLWAIDIQLEADIDMPQLEYFEFVSKDHMKTGDRVILCSAEPSWIYNTSKRVDHAYQNLEFFEINYIEKHGFKLVVTVAGDLHHYARYSQHLSENESYHKLTSGGGGAFMHPTHNLPETLANLRDGDFKLETTFPSQKKSRRMIWRTLLFYPKNWGFGVFISILYLLFGWAVYIASRISSDRPSFFSVRDHDGHFNFATIIRQLFQSFSYSPVAIIIAGLFVFGFYKFCDTDSSKTKGIGLLGVLHGAGHVLLMLTLLVVFTWFNLNVLEIEKYYFSALAITIETLTIGGFLAAVLTGTYLGVSNRFFKIHDNEAFSSMKIENYKNFLRFHFKDNVLTIYPVGIRKIAKWENNGTGFKTNSALRPELMESPIVINLN